LNRREFLWYSFGAVLLFAGVILLIVLAGYLIPTSKEIAVGSINSYVDKATPYPVTVDNVNLYLVNTGSDLIALDRHTPHNRTRCLFSWVAQNNRFEAWFKNTKS
jgi:hypothetical protein